MCDTCGCSDANHTHTHEHEHSHDHGHSHSHEHKHDHVHTHEEGAESRTIKLEKNVLSKNEEAAERNRKWLKDRGIASLNLISSPGTGKTTFLERTLEELQGSVSCGVIVGDQQTDNDAKRLSGKGAPVRQIETVTSCHLDAERVGQCLPEVLGEEAALLFIENVGNLICPAAFSLGEDSIVALLSTTEGEDKPLKYPVVFSKAKVVVLTKIDLAPHLSWNREECLENIAKVSEGARVFEVSAQTGEGMKEWIDYLKSLVA